MAWATTADPNAYLAAAGAFLRARPAENSVLLTATENVRARARGPDGAPLFGWWQAPGAAVAGAFLHTPPHPVALTAMPAGAVDALAARLGDLDRPIAGAPRAGGGRGRPTTGRS
jgi:hypothetical protein